MLRPEDRHAEIQKLARNRTKWTRRVDHHMNRVAKAHPRWSQARVVNEISGR
jgi:hypothetical protein